MGIIISSCKGKSSSALKYEQANDPLLKRNTPSKREQRYKTYKKSRATNNPIQPIRSSKSNQNSITTQTSYLSQEQFNPYRFVRAENSNFTHHYNSLQYLTSSNKNKDLAFTNLKRPHPKKSANKYCQVDTFTRSNTPNTQTSTATNTIEFVTTPVTANNSINISNSERATTNLIRSSSGRIYRQKVYLFSSKSLSPHYNRKKNLSRTRLSRSKTMSRRRSQPGSQSAQPNQHHHHHHHHHYHHHPRHKFLNNIENDDLRMSPTVSIMSDMDGEYTRNSNGMSVFSSLYHQGLFRIIFLM